MSVVLTIEWFRGCTQARRFKCRHLSVKQHAAFQVQRRCERIGRHAELPNEHFVQTNLGLPGRPPVHSGYRLASWPAERSALRTGADRQQWPRQEWACNSNCRWRISRLLRCTCINATSIETGLKTGGRHESIPCFTLSVYCLPEPAGSFSGYDGLASRLLPCRQRQGTVSMAMM
jgi:hypothetical protein